MHALHCGFFSRAYKTLFQHCQKVKQLKPVIKVSEKNNEECIRLTFKNSTLRSEFKVPKNQSINVILNKLKLLATFQKKKEEIHKGISKKSWATSNEAIEDADEAVAVHLYQNDELLDENTPNDTAWPQATNLKIGNALYEVQYNMPTVIELSLPIHIVVGCPIRPHFILDCSSFEDCAFEWYRSILSNNFCEKIIEGNSLSDVWFKVGDGFVYYTTPEDVNCFIKVVCTPKQGNITGSVCTAVSENVVEFGPDKFSFELRCKHIKEIRDNDCIQCLSYNILANMYVNRKNRKEKKFSYATKKALDVYYRKQLILKELLGYKSDIICLQEVQGRMFEYDLLPVMKNNAFEGIYTRKGGQIFEGLATFVRASKFRVLKSYGVLLNEIAKDENIFHDLLVEISSNDRIMSKVLAQDTALQILLLEDKMMHRNLIVANTHLTSSKDTPELRLVQSALCLNYINHVMKTENCSSVGILFCGDFNSLPDSAIYNFMKLGVSEYCSTLEKSTTSSSNTVLTHNLCLDNACGTPKYTNYTDEFQGCLDYIFYSKKVFKVVDVVPMPSHDLVTSQVALPNELFPSDHISLVCTLKWIENMKL